MVVLWRDMSESTVIGVFAKDEHLRSAYMGVKDFMKASNFDLDEFDTETFEDWVALIDNWDDATEGNESFIFENHHIKSCEE